MNTMSLDPGTSGTAWAVWKNSTKEELCSPIWTGQTLGGTGEWLDKFQRIMTSIEQAFGHQPLSHLLLEWPRYMESEGGQKSATSGALVKLCAVCGGIIQIAQRHDIEVVLVEVNDWKGQLPKIAVETRIRKRLGDSWCSQNLKGEHMYHAVGIGLHWKGMF